MVPVLSKCRHSKIEVKWTTCESRSCTNPEWPFLNTPQFVCRDLRNSFVPSLEWLVELEWARCGKQLYSWVSVGLRWDGILCGKKSEWLASLQTDIPFQNLLSISCTQDVGVWVGSLRASQFLFRERNFVFVCKRKKTTKHSNEITERVQKEAQLSLANQTYQ